MVLAVKSAKDILFLYYKANSDLFEMMAMKEKSTNEINITTYKIQLNTMYELGTRCKIQGRSSLITLSSYSIKS